MGQKEMYSVERKGPLTKVGVIARAGREAATVKGVSVMKKRRGLICTGIQEGCSWGTPKKNKNNNQNNNNKTLPICERKRQKDFCASKRQQLAQLLQMWFTLARVHPKLAG